MTFLLDDIDVLETSGDPGAVEVLGIEHDSRRVSPGDLFCCLPGTRTDGHLHAAQAVERGAVGIVCERPVPPLGLPVVQVRVPPGGARPAMARLAAAYWGHPSTSLLTVGVTGTNGKTTVTHLLGAIIAHTGRPVSVLGTLSGGRTTPEATELQRTLATLRDRHAAEPRPAVVMEVSSHALVQSRVEGICFDAALFTNLSHDHLDFHGSMDAYFAAKASLFEPGRARLGVVNVDDRWGRRLADRLRVPVVPVGAGAASEVSLEAGRTRFTWRGERITLAMTGVVNVANALLAAEAAIALGIDPADVAAGLASARPVPGRLETIAGPRESRSPLAVIVDYAHTPDALEAVVSEARRLAAPGSRVLVVFGCGGDRDRAKRPRMGEVASRLADVAVVTSDNPRGEDPAGIVAEILAGVAPTAAEAIETGRLVVEPDRRRAIELALAASRSGDVVVVAGKGHETYQEAGGQRVPFDDRQVVADALNVLRTAPPAPAGD